MNSVDVGALYFGIGGAFYAARYLLVLDPKIAILSQIIFTSAPSFAGGAAIFLNAANVLPQMAYRFSEIMSGFCANWANFFVQPTPYYHNDGGMLFVIAVIVPLAGALLFSVPTMLALPFLPANNGWVMALATLNMGLCTSYFLNRQSN